MNDLNTKAPNKDADSSIKSILEWLALAHGRTGSDDAEPLLRQILALRAAAVPNAQRTKLLDLLYAQSQRVVEAELAQLREISLPVSRKIRQRIRILLELLETLTQDYFNTLAELFDPEEKTGLRAPEISLRRAMHAISWQIRIYHSIASPTRVGLWQQLHAAFSSARRLGIATSQGQHSGQSIQRIYTDILLAAIAQPASFSSAELDFISTYVGHSTPTLELLDSPPLTSGSIFWIDPDKDFPAHALIRRSPSADTPVLYFSCDEIAQICEDHRAELSKGNTTSALRLPKFAASHAGISVLRRLSRLWGHPSKRKFPRRRQSYRAHLCAGLDGLWNLLRFPEGNAILSEWMITNESPDGYSLMHMSGETESLRVGDIVALKAIGEHAEAVPAWHVCIIRWAISENPEHVELGLELLAATATAAEIAQPFDLGNKNGKIAVLILPEKPPLRPNQSLVLPPGILNDDMRRIIALIETENLEIRELRTTKLDEQTSAIEVFSVLPDPIP